MLTRPPAAEARAIAKKKVGGPGKGKKKKKAEEKKPAISQSEMEVWATTNLFTCQLCQPALNMEGKEKFSR